MDSKNVLDYPLTDKHVVKSIISDLEYLQLAKDKWYKFEIVFKKGKYTMVVNDVSLKLIGDSTEG